ncbi:polymeric immunoglobulin receptor-like [Brachyistius frenatus]|uniref:polymeric immunoglobulin receptor-like n=1 Tax=Brachyistius frenatus TaxID=100188 RepID=UPI0037E9A4AB
MKGVHSITTVSKVSVKAGGSITIPCLYESRYINNVKYLCEGNYWRSCIYKVKTNEPRSTGRFSISDDKKKKTFTVTIKNLMAQDAHYWCAVEIPGFKADDGIYFQLSVTREIPRLHVAHQEIIGYNGYSLTINCYSGNSRIMKWCRLGRDCVTQTSGSIDGMRVTINASISSGFTVTMTGLTTKSNGWYWCDTEDFQMPVHVTVTEKPITTTPTPTTVTEGITVATGDGENSSVGNGQHSASVDLKSLIIPLSLLIFIVIVTLKAMRIFREYIVPLRISYKTIPLHIDF